MEPAPHAFTLASILLRDVLISSFESKPASMAMAVPPW